MGLAAHLPGLHSYLYRLVSSRSKPQAPALAKNLRVNWTITSGQQARQALLCVPNVLFFLSHLLFVIVPIPTHSHSSVSALITLRLTHSKSLSLFMIVSHTTDSFDAVSLFRPLKVIANC